MAPVPRDDARPFAQMLASSADARSEAGCRLGDGSGRRKRLPPRLSCCATVFRAPTAHGRSPSALGALLLQPGSAHGSACGNLSFVLPGLLFARGCSQGVPTFRPPTVLPMDIARQRATPAGGGRLLSGARVSTAVVADALRTARNGAAPGLFRATALWHDYRHCGDCYRDGKQLRASDNRRENEMGETANLVAGYQNRRRGKQAAQSAKRGKQAAQSGKTCKSGQSPRPQRRGKSRLRRGGKTRPALRPPTACARGRYQGASSPPTPQKADGGTRSVRGLCGAARTGSCLCISGFMRVALRSTPAACLRGTVRNKLLTPPTSKSSA